MLHLATNIINWSIVILFVVCFSYQLIYLVAKYIPMKKNSRPVVNHRYAVLVAARNEEQVIGRLIESIQKQTYQDGDIDIYVVADNCTDDTAEIAHSKGAYVYTRQNHVQVGKGYALEYLLDQLKQENLLAQYDAYFIFDADNILQENYIEEMNKTFSQGYQVVTSYRNSSNFGTNWITFGYGLWFLHEAQFLNKGRYHVGSCCMVSGTGYMIASSVIQQNDGWKFFLLTEDIEFSADCIVKDIKIGYCEKAEFFDEQPVTFRDSWNQRLRWVKGYYQVFHKYGRQLLGKCVKEHSLSCFDMLMGYFPAFFLTAIASVLGIVMLFAEVLIKQSAVCTAEAMGIFLFRTFAVMFVLGIYTLVTEWRHIHVAAWKKIAYVLVFPLYIYTYFPIAIAAFTCKVSWKPIKHGCIPKSVIERAG